MVEVKETEKSPFPYQNRAKANGISPNLYHSGCRPKVSPAVWQEMSECVNQMAAWCYVQETSVFVGPGLRQGTWRGCYIIFDTRVRNMMARRCVCLCLHLYVCVCWEEDDSFFMAVQRLFDVPVAALAVPGPRLGNSEWQRGKW